MSDTLKAEAGHLRHTAAELLVEITNLKDAIERIAVDRGHMASEAATLERFLDAAGGVGTLSAQATDIGKGIEALDAELERTNERLAVVESERSAALDELKAIETFLTEEST